MVVPHDLDSNAGSHSCNSSAFHDLAIHLSGAWNSFVVESSIQVEQWETGFETWLWVALLVDVSSFI